MTTAVSNLVPYPQVEKEEEEKGETPKPHTPKLQVAVRYLGTRRNGARQPLLRALVNLTPNRRWRKVEGSEAYGAVYPGGSLLFEPPPAVWRHTASRPRPARRSAPTARPSRGWARTSASRRRCCAKKSGHPDYTEPLWRRIEPGSETATERVTGGSDPANPACVGQRRGQPAGEALLGGSLPGAVRRRKPGPSSRDRQRKRRPDRRLRAAAERRRLHRRVRLPGAARLERGRKLRALEDAGRTATCTSPTCTLGSRAIRRSRS